MRVGAVGYALVFAGSLGLCLVLTPLALRAAVQFALLDEPGDHKSHGSPVPYLGGVAILASFSVVVIGAAFFNAPGEATAQVAVVLVLAMVLSALGLLDDLRGLGPVVRVLVEVAAAGTLYAMQGGVEIFHNGVADGMLTVAWIVAVANAFNLLDNMDGLSAGVAGIASVSFFIISAVNGQYLVAVLSIGLAGCAFGFLRHNFHPARIYMGDAGSLFLGFMLAVIGMKLRFENSPLEVTVFVPVVVLGVPLLDMTLVVATRLVHHRSPFMGGRDHTSHRLVFLGLPVPVAVYVIYATTVALGWLSVVMSRLDRATALILMSLVLATGAVTAVLLAAVPVYETSQRRRLMIREVSRHEADVDPDDKDWSRWSA